MLHRCSPLSTAHIRGRRRQETYSNAHWQSCCCAAVLTCMVRWHPNPHSLVYSTPLGATPAPLVEKGQFNDSVKICSLLISTSTNPDCKMPSLLQTHTWCTLKTTFMGFISVLFIHEKRRQMNGWWKRPSMDIISLTYFRFWIICSCPEPASDA